MNHNSETVWQHPSYQPQLNDNRVHVWRANLDLPTAEINQLATFLSTDEIARANKFRFPKHQKRFIAARGILRKLLGNYLQISADNLEFAYSDRGKPRLAASMSDSSLQFNISHSHEYALYGFTHHHPIGVDLEYLREMKDAAKMAERFFSPTEFKLLASLTSEQQQRVFFKLWTAKEAYLKAIGTGLADSLASVDISLDRAECPSLIAIKGNVAAAASWSMYSCIPAINYVATVAIETKITEQQIDFWHWHQD